MKRCLTCHEVYDDKQQVCAKDGSVLVSTSFTKTQELLNNRTVISKHVVAGVAGAVVIAALAFGVFYIFNRQPAPPTPENTAAAVASPEKADETRQPSGAPAPQPFKSKPGYFVIGLSSREQADAMQEMERRNQTGHQTRVTYSSDWSDLSPGFYVVVYGVFDTLTEATAAANDLKSRNVQVYVKYAGSPKSDGAMPTPERDTAQHNADPTATPNTDREAVERQSGETAGEAVSEVMKLWEQRFTRCGDSYVSLDSYNNLRQLKGVQFVISQRRPLTKADELNGFEWGGQVKAKWNVWRRATMQNSNWVWGDWKESPHAFTFDVSKKNSQWRVLNSIYEQKKVKCPDLP